MWSTDPLLLREKFHIFEISPSYGCCAWVVFFLQDGVCASLTHLSAVLFVLYCVGSVHPVLWSFSEEIISYIVVYLFYLWEGVSSESSYASILNPVFLPALPLRFLSMIFLLFATYSFSETVLPCISTLTSG